MCFALSFDISGLHTLTQELSYGVEWKQIESKERFDLFLQQMFPTSAAEKVDEVKSLAEIYHKYKRGYVKHLTFNPDNKNLSKCFIDLPS